MSELERNNRSDENGGTVKISMKNIGGIDECTIEVASGVTLLTGRNATNRSSLLRGLSDVLGGNTARLKSDADEGSIELSLNGEVYSRRFSRTKTGVERSGNPYSEENILVNTFVTLLDDNPVRRAVTLGDDLRDVIMEPVDTDEIERRIQDLRMKRDRLQSKLNNINERRAELHHLEERRESIKNELAQTSDELEDLRSEVEDFEADAGAAEDAEAIVEELDSRRQELNRVEDQIEVTEAELDALNDEYEQLDSHLDDEVLEDRSGGLVKSDEIESLRDRKRQLDDIIVRLNTIVEFNQEIFSGQNINLPGIDGEDSITSHLAPESSQEVVCWTCGNEINKAEITSRLDDLQRVIEENRSERSDLEQEIEILEKERKSIQDKRDQQRRIKEQIDRTGHKIEKREKELETLGETANDLHEEIKNLETKVSKTEELRDSDLLEKYERISDLQYTKGQLQQKLDEVEKEINEIEALPEEETVRAQIQEVKTELENERDRVARVEGGIADAFNDHMAEVLDLLNYENISRVWIERKETHAPGGSKETVFELHIVRESETGSMYEDKIVNLSESEHETVALIVSLAGYLTYEISVDIPFMILDSVESIDSDRIASLIDYFAQHTRYLLVALLPEDAAALSKNYPRIDASLIQ